MYELLNVIAALLQLVGLAMAIPGAVEQIAPDSFHRFASWVNHAMSSVQRLYEKFYHAPVIRSIAGFSRSSLASAIRSERARMQSRFQPLPSPVMSVMSAIVGLMLLLFVWRSALEALVLFPLNPSTEPVALGGLAWGILVILLFAVTIGVEVSKQELSQKKQTTRYILQMPLYWLLSLVLASMVLLALPLGLAVVGLRGAIHFAVGQVETAENLRRTAVIAGIIIVLITLSLQAVVAFAEFFTP